MNYKIKKRHALILAIAGAQAVCLCWGVFVFATWLRSSMREVVQQQVMADNVQTAKQMMALIQQLEVSDLRENRDSWTRLQDTVRDIRLPNDGFVCVTDARDGGLLCHPALTQAPGVLLKNLMLQKKGMPIPNDESAQRQGSELREGDSATQEVKGYIEDHYGEVQIIAAGYMPELDATVNVHQMASGIEKNIARIMTPVLSVGLIVALGLVAVTTAIVFTILQRYDNRLATLNENLEDMVEQRTRSLRRTRDSVIFGLAKLAESRDTDTGEHLERIRIYVTRLANHLSQEFNWIDRNYIDNLGLASSLHDIGKVAIPDRILLKPGRFEPDERAIMETHAEKGGRCLEAISQHLGEDDFLQLSREIAFSHHEKWDGTGYPYQLAASDIPFAARIVALADVYDALRSRRPYKEPMPHEKAKSIILDGSGTHFDPQIVESFLACERDFMSISEKYVAEVSPTADDKAPAEQPVLVET